MKKVIFAGMAVLMALALCGCGAAPNGEWDYWGGAQAPTGDGYFSGSQETGDSGNFSYDSVVEAGYKSTEEEESIYFSLDRNTAGYSQVRAQLNAGLSVTPDSVRIEELINYFSYDYPAPAEGEAVKASTYLGACPWDETHKLVTVGIKTEERRIESERNNYVFLIDVSGSMGARVRGLENESCLGLVKYGIERLVEGLGENDAVSIATYAGSAGALLEPTLATAEGKTKIINTVKKLTANGSTNGSGGLQVAYDMAQTYFSKEGNNRVILLSDGDFNVGLTSQNDLLELIQDKAKSGVYLSVLGVGIGNMRDDFMQTLALNGNGNYAYIDTYTEADKVLGEELNGMLMTVAKDAKAGMTFSKDYVEKYRLIGYDMKHMTEDDFNNAEKDAGEIGSNLCVTALFEVELKENVEADVVIGNVEVRYKNVGDMESAGVAAAEVKNTLSESEDAAFVACVAEFGLILRNSAYKGTASYAAVLQRLNDLSSYIERDVYKSEFETLVQKAQALPQA